MKNLYFTLVMTTLFSVGCNLKPTKIKETHRREHLILQSRAHQTLVLDEKTQVLDVRPAFDYSVYHIENSHSLSWQEFYEKDKKGQYQLKSSTEDLARRLARLGIGLDTPVVVVDKGMNGYGEAPLVAWALVSLGLKDVQVADIEMFKKRFTQKATLPPKNVDYWQALPFSKTTLDFKDKIYVVDVRPARDYNSHPPDKSPQARVINIPWQEFLSPRGRPNTQIKSQLQSIGIYPNQNIVLRSQEGRYSKAVAYLLLSLGYEKISLYEEEYL